MPFLNIRFLLYALIMIVGSTSCSTARKTIYFQDLPSDTTLQNVMTKNFETKIQPGDLLGIKITTSAPDFTSLYNASSDAIGEQEGFLVDEDGNIQLYKLGKTPVAGLTKKELKKKLEKDYEAYFRDNVISVTILNRHVTMLGAVSTKVLPMTEKMTILDALAESGDIDVTGRTDNVLVIREKENSKDFKRLNLTDRSIFYSPYFYLQPNDIVYVEPVKERKANTAQVISLVTTGITFTIFMIDRISRL